MIKVTRRVRFNLNTFVEELTLCLEMEERHEEIDDVVQTYKNFLSRTDHGMTLKVRRYLDKHPQVINNSNLKSFISACYPII
jgi:hypothetical protein